MNHGESSPLRNEELARQLHNSLRPLGIVPLDSDLESEVKVSIGDLRRRRASRFEDQVGILTLLDIDGVLEWEWGALSPMTSATRRRRRGGITAGGEVVTQLKYAKTLGVNKIGEQLAKLDRQLTREGPGNLLRWDTNTWTPARVDQPAAEGKTLLLIHGTFSSGSNLVSELWGHDGQGGKATGADFLRKVASKYTEVLSFEHDTLSRSPLVNALDLSRLFATANPERLDVICHSRGGLVARWWCEVLDRQVRQRRVVFVGCPLQGTSLADPASLRYGLNLLSNVGRTLGSACRLVPFLTAAAGLMQILSSVTSLTARTPLMDAGLAMIPGLAAMSRIVNNYELNTLNGSPPPQHSKYFAVISDFEPDPVSWRFWRLFSKGRLANAAADYLVFEQPNDLVVDSSSMTHGAFGSNPDLTNAEIFCTFRPEDQVHHTNYFTNKRTIEFLEACLRL